MDSVTTPFTPVSPKVAHARLVTLALTMTPLLVGVIVAGFFAPRWMAFTLAAVWVVVAAWAAWVIVRQVRHMGYQRREHDLLITRGVMFRTTTVVPYGRLQFVEVSSGPIDRMFGLAKVELHTASAASDAEIAGMPRHDAEELRDVLARLGEANLAGL